MVWMRDIKEHTEREEMKELLYVVLLLVGMGSYLNAGSVAEYQKICDEGDSVGCNKLGVMYIKGESIKQNYRKAKVLFEKSCSSGDDEGCKKYAITQSLIGHFESGRLPHQNKQKNSNLVVAQVLNPKVKDLKIEKNSMIPATEASGDTDKNELDKMVDWTSDILDDGNQLYNDLKNKTIALYNEDSEVPIMYSEKTKQQRLDNIWSALLSKLKEGASYAEKLNSAPESAWFANDKEDVQDDIDKVLEDIIQTLTGDDLLLYKNKIFSLKEKIHKNKSDILTCRENKIGAPVNSTLYTTKSDYDTKIEKAKIEIKIYENNIRVIKDNLKKNFAEIGVNLTSVQIDILLTRVDGDDIIQMSLIMDVLKHITNQIMQLMKESNEELSQAKKYYGMHLVSLELVVYIQQKYIDKVEKIYIPKIDTIMGTAKKMITKTNHLMFSEKESRRKAIYEKNIEAQKLTYKVAKLYKHDLIKSKENMANAQKISKDNLVLSKNIYATVLLSADLYALVSESQNMFEEVSKIQVPDIVPFENIQIQKKYKELTGLLREK